jgi:glycerol kinase
MSASSGPVVVGIDQGTGSTKAIALDVAGNVVGTASRPVGISYPRSGWVEQDADEIVSSVVSVVASLSASVGRPIAAVGLSTQRESALAWDTATGEALTPVIGWQDRRTSPRARKLSASDAGTMVRFITGLPVDPMFSALKFEWILNEIDQDRKRATAGQITLGTVDAWLVSQLVGERRIEVGNASRTQLLDVQSMQWREELLELFRVPVQALPPVRASDLPTAPSASLFGAAITGVLGDSHAALFGHGIRQPGPVKVTYGTGSSVMGLRDGPASGGLADTIAWSVGGTVGRAFEGNILATGASLVWLGTILGISADEVAELASSHPSGGVDFVPAFAGLASPWWDQQAVGIMSGLTLATSRGELARAAVEAIALQIEDVLAAAELEHCVPTVSELHVDGGPASNDWLMQLQADISRRTVIRPSVSGMSAHGAAWLAGSSIGVWDSTRAPWSDDERTFRPAEDESGAERKSRWAQALRRSRLIDLNGASRPK